MSSHSSRIDEMRNMRPECERLGTSIVHKAKDLLGEITSGEMFVVGKLAVVSTPIIELRDKGRGGI